MRPLLAPTMIGLVALVWGCEVAPVPPTGEVATVGPGAEPSLAAPSTESAAENPPVSTSPAASNRPRPEGSEASLGEGFLVWETNRTGSWRIWTRPLEGGAPRQLVPDEAGRQHYAPHISPDGRWVAYLSARDSGKRYPEGGVLGSLRLIPAAGGEPRVLVEGARTYFENRSAVWRSPEELIYIGEDLRTRLIHVDTGETRLLTAAPASGMGFLIDRPLRYASSNSATFSVFEEGTQRVLPRANLGGCQPYFSHDGRWGVWTAGAGGPIRKIELDSRRAETMLAKNDSRMTDGLGYMYFPMLSRDGSLLALGASRNEHDHFTSDYEIFVVEVDPQTLDLVGVPRRFTEDPGTDRYPDVYRRPAELGRYRGEAPFDLTIEASIADSSGPDDGWRWTAGDGSGSIDGGTRFEHRYETPGSYTIEARRGDLVLRGRVVVAVARPPRLLASHLSGDGARVDLEVDEPVSLDGAVVTRESGLPVAGVELGPDRRTITIELGAPLEGTDRLTLEGLRDEAAVPNTMEPTTVAIGPLAWPAVRDGLVFAWQTGDASNLVADASGSERAITLTPSGDARLDRHWAMLPGNGRFTAAAEDSARIKAALQGSNEMTIEMTLRAPRGPGATLVAAADARRLNFRLDRRGGGLRFEFRAKGRGPDAQPAVDLFPLPVEGSSHVVVTYSPAKLVAYLDGEKRFEAGAEVLRGDFFHWRNLPLFFGAGQIGQTAIEGVAIFDRVLDEAEVATEYERYALQLASRQEVQVSSVRARLIASTPPPTLDQISPYREALVVSEYELLGRGTGRPIGDRIRVAHWAILDAQRLPLNDRPVGEIFRLSLEPFDANPQLASLFLGQAETIDSALPLYYSAALQAKPERSSD